MGAEPIRRAVGFRGFPSRHSARVPYILFSQAFQALIPASSFSRVPLCHFRPLLLSKWDIIYRAIPTLAILAKCSLTGFPPEVIKTDTLRASDGVAVGLCVWSHVPFGFLTLRHFASGSDVVPPIKPCEGEV